MRLVGSHLTVPPRGGESALERSLPSRLALSSGAGGRGSRRGARLEIAFLRRSSLDPTLPRGGGEEPDARTRPGTAVSRGASSFVELARLDQSRAALARGAACDPRVQRGSPHPCAFEVRASRTSDQRSPAGLSARSSRTLSRLFEPLESGAAPLPGHAHREEGRSATLARWSPPSTRPVFPVRCRLPAFSASLQSKRSVSTACAPCIPGDLRSPLRTSRSSCGTSRDGHAVASIRPRDLSISRPRERVQRPS